MSVYSGFATRQQENKYNNLIETLVIALKKRLIKFYAGQACDQSKFKLLVKKLYKKMYLLQKGKFMPPKFSTCFADLIHNLGIQIDYDNMSQCSSMMSQTFSLRKDSADPEKQQLKSNALLNNKKNLMQIKASKIFNSTLSLEKKFTIPVHMNQQEIDNTPHFQPRSTSLQPEPFKPRGAKIKLNELKNLKQLRGTINMPRVEDFLPKKQQISVRKNTFLDNSKPPQNSPKAQKPVFRRQKYSRAEIPIQDI